LIFVTNKAISAQKIICWIYDLSPRDQADLKAIHI
jgi:hypothetical protein